jgi:hypothetical protein
MARTSSPRCRAVAAFPSSVRGACGCTLLIGVGVMILIGSVLVLSVPLRRALRASAFMSTTGGSPSPRSPAACRALRMRHCAPADRLVATREFTHHPTET